MVGPDRHRRLKPALDHTPEVLMQEIERRFLCRVERPDALRAASGRSEIRQGYLTEGEPAVRVRARDGEYLLTIKAGRGLVRDEVEVVVDEESGEKLFEMAGDRQVEKVRYVIDRWEVDVFRGPLEGLVMAEVELRSPGEPLPSVPAGIALLRDVTDDPRFTNQNLARLAPDAARDLVREVVKGAPAR
jgi:adenylate cyclase